ncbi:MAG: sugar phosphate isomerase/epimerase family protein [Janthinobacterium lividum]
MMTPQPLFGVSEFTTWPWSFEQDIEHYARLGVDAIEICEFKLSSDAVQAEEQMSLVRAAGLVVSSVQPRLHSLFPDAPRPEPKAPDARMALLRESIVRFGRLAPGTTLVTITGAAPAGNFRDAFEVAVREYTALADFAAAQGIKIALEPLNPILMNADTFLCSLPEALRIVHAVSRPNFGIWVDVWHVWQDAAAAEHIRACGDRIFGVHINDWHTPRCFGDRAVIGQGEIDLPPLLRAIHAAGYRGACTLELFSEDWLPDSLWRSDLDAVIQESRNAFQAAWRSA